MVHDLRKILSEWSKAATDNLGGIVGLSTLGVRLPSLSGENITHSFYQIVDRAKVPLWWCPYIIEGKLVDALDILVNGVKIPYTYTKSRLETTKDFIGDFIRYGKEAAFMRMQAKRELKEFDNGYKISGENVVYNGTVIGKFSSYSGNLGIGQRVTIDDMNSHWKIRALFERIGFTVD